MDAKRDTRSKIHSDNKTNGREFAEISSFNGKTLISLVCAGLACGRRLPPPSRLLPPPANSALIPRMTLSRR